MAKRKHNNPRLPVERFWALVDKNGPVPEKHPELGPCWIFTGCKDKKGYGAFRKDGKACKAHRVAWELSGRTLRPDLDLDHICGNPACSNPSHCQAITHAEHMAEHGRRGDMTNEKSLVVILRNRAIRASTRTQCDHGHELTPKNVRTDRRTGKRICKICARGWQQKRRAKSRSGPDNSS